MRKEYDLSKFRKNPHSESIPVSDNKKQKNEKAFVRAVLKGLRDAKKGRTFSTEEVKAKLGLK